MCVIQAEEVAALPWHLPDLTGGGKGNHGNDFTLSLLLSSRLLQEGSIIKLRHTKYSISNSKLGDCFNIVSKEIISTKKNSENKCWSLYETLKSTGEVKLILEFYLWLYNSQNFEIYILDFSLFFVLCKYWYIFIFYNCFSIYHTSWITSGPKCNFISDKIPTKASSEMNSTWLITSELGNQRARKVLFTCVVYTNLSYSGTRFLSTKNWIWDLVLYLSNRNSSCRLRHPCSSKYYLVPRVLSLPRERDRTLGTRLC